MRIQPKIICFLALTLCVASLAFGERIGSIGESEITEQIARFFSFRDGTVRLAVAGGIMLGASCGLLGSFIVVRKMALMGDTISHAVLPGVALGFLWHLTKDPVAIFIGAIAAGSLGALTVFAIRRTTHLKEDVAMGMVLAGFYGLGICLMTYIQGLSQGNFSGLDKFLFGQAAALSGEDIKLMGMVSLISLGVVVVFFKEFSLFSFDRGFAAVSGLPVILLDLVFMLLLASSIVVSLQAVGVVLVSAMLITPAATAYLISNRFSKLIIVSVILGMLSGFFGAFLSFLGNRLPTGPFMVLSATSFFVIVWIFAPRHGIVPKFFRLRKQKHLAEVENILKQVYHIMEDDQFSKRHVSTHELARRRKEPIYSTHRCLKRLEKENLIQSEKGRSALIEDERVELNKRGFEAAQNMTRRHRLWELYLTQSAKYADDHVHIDAERVEHVLSQKALDELDERLGYPEFDPHGKRIPRGQPLDELGGVI